MMGGEHFYETSSTLITIIVFGKYLEHKVPLLSSLASSSAA